MAHWYSSVVSFSFKSVQSPSANLLGIQKNPPCVSNSFEHEGVHISHPNSYKQNYPQDTRYFLLYCQVHSQCLFNWDLLFQHHIYPIVGPASNAQKPALYFTLWTESSNLYQTLKKKRITKSRNASVRNRNTIGAPRVFVLRQFPLYAKRNAWRESSWW